MKTSKQLFAEIALACRELGWCISFNTRTKKVKYLIIGEEKEVDRLLKKLGRNENRRS